LLFGTLILQMSSIAQTIRDPFGRTIVYGVSALFFLNTFQHMGMNVGILPITGVPLPFISYGGSAVLTAAIGIGLIFSVVTTEDIRAERVIKHTFKKKSS